MSKFRYSKVESTFLTQTYVVEHEASGKTIGTVAKAFGGWMLWLPVSGREEFGYRTRTAASERLLLVSGVNPVAWSALPADPFDGISA